MASQWRRFGRYRRKKIHFASTPNCEKSNSTKIPWHLYGLKTGQTPNFR